MKNQIKHITFTSLVIIILFTVTNPLTGMAQTVVPPTDTATPAPTMPPVDTPSPEPRFERPLVVIGSYEYGNDRISPGNDFNLKIRLKNNGESDAYNIVISFESADFLPLASGGVRAVPYLDTGASVEITQPLRAQATLWGYSSGSIVANVSYTDAHGAAYTERFTLTIDLRVPVYTTPQPTVTPTLQARAQLVVGGYEVDVNPLQPGTIFNLTIDVRNLGAVSAQNVTMVLGGGVTVPSGQDGTGGQQSGGVIGTGADLSVFAPLGSSNLIFIDDVEVGQMKTVTAQLIVNVTANPGAYPFKISFTYLNAQGERVVDDQVITLLVYSMPKVEIGFYRNPGNFIAGQMNPLPIQITNLGKNTAVLGTLTITSENADLTDNTILVGSLEPGGYFTMDAMAMPYQEGELNLLASISYSDDFNQPRKFEQTLTVMVDPEPVYEDFPGNGMDEQYPPMEQPETFLQKVWRFIKGLLGLGSGKAQPQQDFTNPDQFNGENPDYNEPMPMPAPKG